MNKLKSLTYPLLFITLISMFVVGCKLKTNVNTVWRESGGFFETNDLPHTQKVIPFKIILPTYLPDNMENKQPFYISGPSDKKETDQISLDIEYGEEPKKIALEESNFLIGQVSDAAHNPSFVDINGIQVLEEKYNSFSSTPDNPIIVSSFTWYQGNFTLRLEAYTYSEDEAIKVVKSIINQKK
jgi:hypothetical protein